MKTYNFSKKIFTIAIAIIALLIPNIKSQAFDVSHFKIGVGTVGECFTTTYGTFNYPAFLYKHQEIGFCDKETAWAYYEMYCKPYGELAPCSLKAYMDYTEFDVNYFLQANGITFKSYTTDSEIFDYFCDYYPAYFWDAKGLTPHADALIKANYYFWIYNLYVNGASDLQVIFNFYTLPSSITEYYTPNDPYSDPYTWAMVTSIDGPMLYGLGNCQGYANFFLLMMDMSGIPCQTVYSENHMWNDVYYNGSWYACDTCWADNAFNHTSATTNWFMVAYK